MAENDGLFGMGGIGLLVILFFLMSGGFGGFGGNNAYATSNEVQRGFDNQNSMANQREILSATNQVYHDLTGYVGDKYAELDRDVLGIGNSIQQVIANQNDCCCSTKMLIQETAAQNRYDALLNTNAINANIVASNQKVLDALAQNKIDALESKVAELQMANQLQNVVRYPTTFAWNAGTSPFCGGCGV